MGWIKKAVILFVGLALLGSGLWLFGVLCLGYLVISFFTGKGRGTQPAPRGHLSVRPSYIAAAALLALALVAFASGGIFSPIVFGALALVVLLWPFTPLGLMASRVDPVSGTILLRSTFFPFVWHSVAEVKPGAEDLARALSSYEGKLLITKRGAVYAHVKVLALEARTAEEKVTGEFRRIASTLMPGGAYLLPMDCEASSKTFVTKLSSVSPRSDPLAGPAPDLLVLDASGGFVSRSGSYVSVPGESRGTIIPDATWAIRKPPLTWEAIEALGKKLRWPEPDSFSNLLQSVHASRNEPLAERLARLETSEKGVTVEALGGDRVDLTRPQLRSLLKIYS